MKKRKEQNIRQLNTYSIDNTLQNIRQEKRDRFVRRRSLAILISGICLVVLVAMPLIKNHYTTEKLEAVHVEALEELAEVKETQSSLQYQVQLLEDEEYVAKLARKELNLSKDDEILINLPEKEETVKEQENK